LNQVLYEKADEAGQIGEGKTYYLITFGCQMNEHDSEVIMAMLEGIGYSQATAAEEADLIMINTCAVRKKPEDKVASLLGKYAALKKDNSNLLIAVGGCMAQQEDVVKYLSERFEFVDLLFGTHALPRLPELLYKASRQKKTVIALDESDLDRENLPISRKSAYKAWIPIIYGCNNYCSYCVVPYVRGRERSRKPDQIIKEAVELAEQGYLEITLLGQNVNSYGHDLPLNITFAGLLAELDSVKGIERIRFMTSHPKDLSTELINVVAGGQKICEHFHLPVQSGSNRILKKMNRRYNREQYLALIGEIKSAVSDVAITSDLIVGFPGEEEEDLMQTADLLKKARFDNAFSFIYSKRMHTAAASLNDTLSHEQKEKRLQYLNNIQHQISKEINALLADRIIEVLVEGPSKNNPSLQTGRTRSNKLVHFNSTANLEGQLVKVKITDVRTWNLIGELEGDYS
jgi:tRNA-2-methylthio-N6-dimethylallyladenosine synthase